MTGGQSGGPMQPRTVSFGGRLGGNQEEGWSGAVWGPGEFAVKGFVVGDFGISFSPAYKMTIWPKRMPTKLSSAKCFYTYLAMPENETPSKWAAMPHGRSFPIGRRGDRERTAGMLASVALLQQEGNHESGKGSGRKYGH